MQFSITTEGELSLVATTAKTILQLAAPANQRVAMQGFSVSFKGTSGSAEPVLVEVVKQTTAGTMSSATEVKEGGEPETVQSVGQRNASAEPTTTDIYRQYLVHPQTGAEWKLDILEEIIIPGGGRVGIRCTAPANVNCVGHISAEE